MFTCTFFGHKDAPKKIEPTLRLTLIDLIENQNVRKFYVGNHGNFDDMVRRCLIELKEIYPIEYAIVLSYFPGKKYGLEIEKSTDTLLPDGIEAIPRKFAIKYCNKWMIEQSNYVVTYVTSTIGGAAQFKELAEKKKKIVINIATQNLPET